MPTFEEARCIMEENASGEKDQWTLINVTFTIYHGEHAITVHRDLVVDQSETLEDIRNKRIPAVAEAIRAELEITSHVRAVVFGAGSK